MAKVVWVKMEIPKDTESMEELQSRHAKFVAKHLVNNYSSKELDTIIKKLKKV